MLTTLSLPQASTAPHGKVSPEPLVPTVGKGNPSDTTSPLQHCGSLCRRPSSYLTPQGLQRHLGVQPLEI